MTAQSRQRGSAVLMLVIGTLVILTAFVLLLGQSRLRSGRAIPAFEETLDVHTLLYAYVSDLMEKWPLSRIDNVSAGKASPVSVPGYRLRPVGMEETETPAIRALTVAIERVGGSPGGKKEWTWRILLECREGICRVMAVEEQNTANHP